MGSSNIPEDTVDPSEISVSWRDYWEYTPEKDQWEKERWFQRGSYRLVRFYSFVGITSNRWKQLVRLNKLRDLGYGDSGEARRLSRRYE